MNKETPLFALHTQTHTKTQAKPRRKYDIFKYTDVYELTAIFFDFLLPVVDEEGGIISAMLSLVLVVVVSLFAGDSVLERSTR